MKGVFVSSKPQVYEPMVSVVFLYLYILLP